MKYGSTALTVLAFVLVGSLCVGCGGSDSPAGITGPWTFNNLSAALETITFNQAGGALTGSTDAGGSIAGTISENNVDVTVTYANTVVTFDLTWDGANSLTGTQTDLQNNTSAVTLNQQQTTDTGTQTTADLQGQLNGTWTGSCDTSGGVSGAFMMNIDADGIVTGTYNGTANGTIAGAVSGSGSFSSLGSGTGTDGVEWSGVIQQKNDGSIRGSGTWSGDDDFGGTCTGTWRSNNW
jgi:hypothetical protein